MAHQHLPRSKSVVVSGGTGTVSFTESGVGIGYGVKAPLSNSSYSIEMLDGDNFGLVGENNCVGNITITQRFQMHEKTKITITGDNGTYTVRIWFNE